MAKFVSQTNGTVSMDGAKGSNNKMVRGASVVANKVAPGGSQRSKERTSGGTKTGGDSEFGAGVSPRMTPKNQHGLGGKVEPASKQSA